MFGLSNDLQRSVFEDILTDRGEEDKREGVFDLESFKKFPGILF